MARKGLIKVYGGVNGRLNRVVRRWLENVGCMYYPYDKEVTRLVKGVLGFNEQDTVVQRKKKSMAVYGVYDGMKQELYDYLDVERRFRV